jgi:hypothetical protein
MVEPMILDTKGPKLSIRFDFEIEKCGVVVKSDST